MSRTPRIVLAVVALALTAGGAAIGRFAAGQQISATIATLASLKAPTAGDLGAGLEMALLREMLGETLLGMGLVLWTVLGARAAKASAASVIGAAIVVLGAGAAAVALPVSRLPLMTYVHGPPNEWPYGVVSFDKAYWNAFIVRTPQDEWAIVVEHGHPNGPEGLRLTLERCLAATKKPVRVYLDLSCPEDSRKIFLAAAHKAADPAGVGVEDEALPDKEDFPALLRKRHQEQLTPFKDTLQIGILARLASAAALALVVWWMPRTLRGGSFVTGGNLLLAFGQLVALPVALYAAAIPEPGGPNFRTIATHLPPHIWIVDASSLALVLGSLVAMAGHAIATDETPPETARPKKERSPELPPSASS